MIGQVSDSQSAIYGSFQPVDVNHADGAYPQPQR
jgi:hypothetical protein